MSWRESDDAIGDLLQCRAAELEGDLDYPEKVGSWWADHKIPISRESLGRQDLFRIAATADESGDLVPLLWHVLAWGVIGDLRNAPTWSHGSSSKRPATR